MRSIDTHLALRVLDPREEPLLLVFDVRRERDNSSLDRSQELIRFLASLLEERRSA